MHEINYCMKSIFTVMLFLAGTALVGQIPMGSFVQPKGKGKISGITLDSLSGKPIEYASIAIFRSGSDKPIDGALTDDKGQFDLIELRNGTYDLRISSLAFVAKDIKGLIISDSVPVRSLGQILVTPVDKVLDEVNITGQSALVENKLDKTIYNAGKDISNKGGNAGDVLRKVPGLSVDLDGNIFMRGSQNIKVLINGKPSAVMASNVAEAMKMIPSDEIDKVEVITSPGAKYDAEGSAGIINIITKRKTIKGVSGSMNVSAGTRSSYLGTNINVKYDKWGFNAGLGGFGWQAKGRMDANRATTEPILAELIQGGASKTRGLGGSGNFGLDYDINESNNVNGSISYRRFGMDLNNNILTELDANGSKLTLFRRAMDSKIKNNSLDATLDYKHKFNSEGKELSVAGQFSNNIRPTGYDITQYNALDIRNYAERSDNRGTNREITGQMDYSHPFSKKLNVDAGIKAIFRRVESIYNFDTLNIASNTTIKDLSRSSAFGYLQDVYAAYSEATWYVDNHWGLKAGLRYETTNNQGDLYSTERKLDQQYDNLLPSATVSYKFGANSVKVAYNQRLQRPGLFYLNPYTNQSDIKNITRGNPNLEAELTHNIEAGYNTIFGISSVNFSVYRRMTNNAIEAVRSISNDTIVTSYFNQAHNKNTGINISGNWMKGYKFMLAGNFDLSYVEIENKSLGVSNSGINYGINGFLNWTLVDVWGLQGYAGIRGPTFTAQGRSTSFYFYGLGAKRDLLKKKATLSLGLDNFLTPKQKLITEFESNGIKYKSVNEFYAFGARISFNWMFGKMQFSNKRNQKSINNSDIKSGEDNQNASGMRN